MPPARRRDRQRAGEIAVELEIATGCGRLVRCLGDGNRAAAPRAGDIDGFAVGDRDQPCLDVGVGGQVRIGLHGGQERLRPGVVGVGACEYRPEDTQHGCPVRRDDRLERLFVHLDAYGDQRFVRRRPQPELLQFQQRPLAL